jgi:perosamine synthetase
MFQMHDKMNFKSKTLAINGGKPVRTKGWSDNFTLGEEEKKAAIRAIESGYLSLFEGSHTPDHPFSFLGGPEVQALEAEWCSYYNIKHSISVNSATSGLYAAIGALGVGFGDEVIVSPYTMSACAVAPMVYGAIPVFADVELDSGSLDPDSIEQNITERTKAILVVHQFGIPANMSRIMEIARKHNLKVIEDCAQAHQAKVRDKFVGAIGDIGVFSLNVNKTIQTGEGGVCTTNDDDLAYRLQLIRNHGEAVVGPAGYENITNIVGFNYRLTEVQAAMAREQLAKLGYLTMRRLELVAELAQKLKPFDFLDPLESREGTMSTYYVCPMRYHSEKTGVVREKFISAVNAEGILFYQGYVEPLYLQPLYQNRHLFKNGYPFTAPENRASNPSYNLGTCPNAEQLHFKEMVINEHVRLPHQLSDIRDIVRAIDKVARS